MYVHIYTLIRIYTYEKRPRQREKHKCTHIWKCIYRDIYADVCLYIRKYLYTSTNIYIYIYIYISTDPVGVWAFEFETK